jgi:hypothetical protein
VQCFFYFGSCTKTAPAKTEAVKSKLTPKEVIDKYLTALGGKDKLEAVKSIVMENTISVLLGEITMTTKNWAINSNLNSFLWDRKRFSVF